MLHDCVFDSLCLQRPSLYFNDKQNLILFSKIMLINVSPKHKLEYNNYVNDIKICCDKIEEKDEKRKMFRKIRIGKSKLSRINNIASQGLIKYNNILNKCLEAIKKKIYK